MEINQDINHRPLIFIRFNPDGYINSENKNATSCFGYNNLGISVVKKSKQNEWNDRLNSLKTQIEYWSKPENKTEKTIEIIQLFFDEI